MESELESELEFELESELEFQLEFELETELESELEFQLQSELEFELEPLYCRFYFKILTTESIFRDVDSQFLSKCRNVLGQLKRVFY